MMHTVFRLSMAIYLSILLASKVDAQLTGFYPIGADSLSLNNADFSLLVDAANGLLRKSPLRIGASTSWRNQQTGSNGTIRVTKTFHQDGMLCHTLSYETIPAATPPANTTVLNWCKTPDNQWKILS
jgi:hypothetical protein